MSPSMNNDRQEISVSLQDLVAFVLRGALLAAVLAGVVGAATYLLTQRQPAVFRAESTLLVARGGAGFTQFGLSPVTAPPIDLGAYRVAVESDPVLTDALRLLGVAEPTVAEVRSLRGRIGSATETGVRDSSLLRVEGRGDTAASAIGRANAVAAALVAWDRRRASESIDRVITTLVQQIEALSEQVRALQAVGDANLQSQIDGLVRLRAEQQQQLGYARALVASAEGLLSVLQPADSTARQVAPRPAMTAAVAALLAAIGVYALLLLQSAFNTRLRGPEDIGVVTGLPVLAEFPSVGRQEFERLREPSSYLRTNLLFATEEAHPRVFMVTSAVAGEGKTTVARHLAEGFVRYGYRTLLVDADLREPSVADGYDIVGAVPDAATTESWLADAGGTHHILTVTLDGDGQLDVIPQFKQVAHAPELLGRGFRLALARWQEYDVVVVDSPPLLAVADPLTIAPHCTGTVLVVDHHKADRRRLTAAVGSLQRLGVRILGVVANNVGTGSSSVGYGAPYGDAAPRSANDRMTAASAVAPRPSQAVRR
jgi:capsular exopolysaccharide synthesis family protein